LKEQSEGAGEVFRRQKEVVTITPSLNSERRTEDQAATRKEDCEGMGMEIPSCTPIKREKTLAEGCDA